MSQVDVYVILATEGSVIFVGLSAGVFVQHFLVVFCLILSEMIDVLQKDFLSVLSEISE